MELRTHEAERLLAKLGVDLVASTHYCRGFVTYDGIRLLPICFSRESEIMLGQASDRLARSLMLTPDEFRSLKECSMTKEEYFASLRVRGLIPDTPEG